MEKKKKVIIAAVAGVVLAVIAIIAVVMYSNGGSSSGKSDTAVTETTLPVDATMNIEEDETVTTTESTTVTTTTTPETTTETTTSSTAVTKVTKKVTEVAEPIEYSSSSNSSSGSNIEQETTEAATEPEYRILSVENLTVNTVSVSSLSVAWDADENRAYEVEVIADAEYADNICFNFKGNWHCYLTGLREGSEYTITVRPLLSEDEDEAYFGVESASSVGYTEAVTVKKECELPSGQTNHFLALEKANLLLPDVLTGTIADIVTDTGISRNAYGDYCCAVPECYGNIGDRLLVELEDGTQFTVSICNNIEDAVSDNEADTEYGTPEGQYIWIDKEKDEKCVIEFVYEDGNLPENMPDTYDYGINWEAGLNLTANIKSIKQIEYGDFIIY